MEQNNILKDNGGQDDIHTKTDENCDHVLKNWDKIIQANIHSYEIAEILTLKNSKNWRRNEYENLEYEPIECKILLIK